MASLAIKKCGCKGVRRCLICEDQLPHNDNAGVAFTKEYTYCSICRQAWSGDDRNAHPDHAGEHIDFRGIDILTDFVTASEEEMLCSKIDEKEWSLSQSGRRKQDFGPKVNFKKQKVRIGNFAGFPPYSRMLVERFSDHPLLDNFIPVELCNLEYCPERGSSIDPHFDDWWLWGERLVTLNLLAPIVETFTDDSQPGVYVNVDVPRRSLIVVGGPARFVWKHAIRRDSIPGRRIAMTFRELSPEFCAGGLNEKFGNELVALASSFNG